MGGWWCKDRQDDGQTGKRSEGGVLTPTKGDGRLKAEEASGQFGLKRALRVIITWAARTDNE